MGLLGSVVGGVLGLIGNKQTNSANAAAANNANQFTTEQLKNRHQWEVEDLRKAGLNPILSAGGTPSIGSSAKAEVEPRSQAVQRGIEGASSAKKTAAEIAVLKSQEQLNKDTSQERLTGAVHNLSSAAKQDADRRQTEQWLDIKKPAADISKAIGDVTGRFKGWDKWGRDNPPPHLRVNSGKSVR